MTNIPKFRAFVKYERVMVNVDVLNLIGKEIHCYPPQFGIVVSFNFKDCILMQSTGLRDKNGVEIFCGDIIRVTDNFINVSVHQVVWGVDYPAFDLLPVFHPTCNGLSWILGENVPFEVIGNIYQQGYLINDTDNCVNYCAYVEEDGTCCGQCVMTIKPIETITDAELSTASPLLQIKEI